MDLPLPVSVTSEDERGWKGGKAARQRGHGLAGLGQTTDDGGGREIERERERNRVENGGDGGDTETGDGEDGMGRRCDQCERNPSLFCQDEWTGVCRDCAATGRHRRHEVHPVAETVKDCKAKLQSAMKTLLGSKKATETVIQTCSQADRFIPLQARQSETQIKEEFEKLHRFLRKEEEARLVALGEEEEERKRRLQERRDALRKEMCSVWFAVKTSERDSRSDDITFLQNYKNTVKRSWQSYTKPETVCGPLINRAKHVANLRYTVWEKMRHIAPYTPVTLDPNTANSYLSLSRDLTAVRESVEDDDAEGGGALSPGLPDTPERFTCCGEMLASRGFSSGTHSWLVDVHDNSSWILGVATESIVRKKLVVACPEEGVWALSMRRGRFEALDSPPIALSIPSSSSRHRAPTLRLVRVCLDYDGGRLSFREADSDAHLFTFAHPFTSSLLRAAERVYPYFATSCGLATIQVVTQEPRVEVWIPAMEEEEREEEEEEEEPKTPEEMGRT